jgi:glyoxylase-like metal-dependent hydrolase (beta-lactamase superfamily II)
MELDRWRRIICVGWALLLVPSPLHGSSSKNAGAGTPDLAPEITLGTSDGTQTETPARQTPQPSVTTAGRADTAVPVVMGLGTPLAKLPGYSGGTLSAIKPCGSGYSQAIIYRTNEKQFDHYCASLQRNGFTLYAAHTVTNNYFRTYRKGALMAHAYLVGASGQVRIVAAENATMPARSAPGYTKVKDASFTFFGLERGGSDGGLGCMFQFEDGSFFIVDGGHDTAAETKDLYDKLRELAPDKNRIVIRGWLITHAHGDHYGAFLRFAGTYGSLSAIKIESFIFNFCNTTEQTQYLKDRGRSMSAVFSTIAGIYPGAAIYKPLTGQTFHYAGADMEVLYCMSDFLPQIIGTEMSGADKADADGNIQTVVFRVKLAGQTILVTGDTAKVCVDEMCARYGTSLKSDMMTVPHHGWNQNRYRARNGTIQFYTLVDPTVVFWPDGVKAQAEKMAWNGKSGGNWEANCYLLNRLHVKQCLVAGSATQSLTLPYKP